MFLSKLLTIILSCENENIVKCLEFLDSQYKIKNTRVILLNHYLTDIKSIIKLSNYKNLKIDILDVTSIIQSKNEACDLVVTPYILFLDGNMLLVDIRTIDECLKDMLCLNLDLVTIKYRHSNSDKNYIFSWFEFIRDLFFDTPFVLKGFMMLNKEIFTSLGGFNKTCEVNYDFELTKNVQPSKFRINNYLGITLDNKIIKKGLFSLIYRLISSALNRTSPFCKKN